MHLYVASNKCFCFVYFLKQKSTGYINKNFLSLIPNYSPKHFTCFLCGDRVPFCRINGFRLCGENHRINDFESVYAARPLCGVTHLSSKFWTASHTFTTETGTCYNIAYENSLFVCLFICLFCCFTPISTLWSYLIILAVGPPNPLSLI